MIRRLYFLAALWLCAVAQAVTTIPVNDAQWIAAQPPQVAYNNGSSYTLPINEGWNANVYFTGGLYRWTLNLSALSGYGSGYFPTLKYRIGGGSWTRAQLTDGQTSITFASGLSDTTHTAEVYLDGLDASSNTNRWSAGLPSVKITGIVVDDGKTITAMARPSNILWYVSDSLGSAQVALGAVTGGNYSFVCSGSLSHCVVLANSWGWDLVNTSFPSQGYTTGGLQGVPVPSTSVASILNGVSRTFATKPKRAVIQFGTNDTYATSDEIRDGCAGTITAVRAQAGPSCDILVLVPFGGYVATEIGLGVAKYQADNPSDTRVALYDMSTAGDAIIQGNSYESGTKIHPNSTGQALLGALEIANLPGVGGTATATSATVATLTISP